jgi:hydrogenase nickel incorporation protein HypA/HybF
MHELSILQGLIEQVEQAVANDDGCRVLKVRVEVGEMSGVVPEALEFAYEISCAGTVLEGAELVIETVSVKQRCRQCEKEFDVKDLCFLCPDCGSSNLEKLSGFELRIREIEIEEDNG